MPPKWLTKPTFSRCLYTGDALAELAIERQGNAIHLLGSFNPRLFQPAWLAAHNLIRDAESETAEIRIIHSDIVSYALDWVRVEVEGEKLAIISTANSETPEQLRDLAVGVLEVLSHTPVYTVGIQFWGHYALESQEARDDLGWRLVPPDPFKEHLAMPGMTTLRVSGSRSSEDDPDGGGLIVTVEPSNRVNPNGVYISVLDQYELADQNDADATAGPAVACLKENWAASGKRAKAIPETVLAPR